MKQPFIKYKTNKIYVRILSNDEVIQEGDFCTINTNTTPDDRDNLNKLEFYKTNSAGETVSQHPGRIYVRPVPKEKGVVTQVLSDEDFAKECEELKRKFSSKRSEIITSKNSFVKRGLRFSAAEIVAAMGVKHGN